jgi:hypothetical protein
MSGICLAAKDCTVASAFPLPLPPPLPPLPVCQNVGGNRNDNDDNKNDDNKEETMMGGLCAGYVCWL